MGGKFVRRHIFLLIWVLNNLFDHFFYGVGNLLGVLRHVFVRFFMFLCGILRRSYIFVIDYVVIFLLDFLCFYVVILRRSYIFVIDYGVNIILYFYVFMW